MDSFAFDRNSPKTFILGANNWSDLFLGDDQVWSLVFNHADSHPFHLYTTYGLKARSVQIFPEILKNNQALHADKHFTQAPAVTHYNSDFLRIVYELALGLAVEFNVVAPEPTALAGTIFLKNIGQDSLGFKLALISHLLPLGKGARTHADKDGRHQFLSGKAGDLCPVLYMTGGPSAANTPFPALTLPLQLAPGETYTATWAMAANNTQEDSLKTAKRLTYHPWQQSVQQRLIDHDRKTILIHTGDPDWDAAFRLAQSIPDTHFIQRNPGESAPYVVRTRLHDQPPLNAQNIDQHDDMTTLELNHLAQVLLPQRVNLMASLITKFLNRIEENGHLLSKRNVSPYIKPYQEPPLLAGLCLEIFEISRDEAFLQKVFPPLCRITDTWLFSTSVGTPNKPLTWQNPDQCQLRSGLFQFDIWEETGGGIDIQTVESPALLAMLLREVRSLQQMAEILEAAYAAKRYGKLETYLIKNLEGFWNEETQTYRYRDYQSKTSPKGEEILNTKVQNTFSLERDFESPQRLVCHLRACDEQTRVCHLIFKGLDSQGKQLVEAFEPSEVRWISGRAHLTSRELFSALQTVTSDGLASGDEIRLETADLSRGDITCLAPIWSGSLPPDHLQSLLENSLDWEHPDLSRGIPEAFPLPRSLPEGFTPVVNVLWNTLIIQGLARKGCSETAARLFENLMSSIIAGLRNYDGFFPCFQVKDGRPLGKPNAIPGLPPFRLFLEIAGIRILTVRKVALWGKSPFSWPFDLNWQGLSIHREDDRAQITFPDGTTCSHSGMEPVLITPESEGL